MATLRPIFLKKISISFIPVRLRTSFLTLEQGITSQHPGFEEAVNLDLIGARLRRSLWAVSKTEA